LGQYPFRHLEHARSAHWLLGQMDRLRIDCAWVGHLSAFLYKDPAPGNAALERFVAPHGDRLVALPTVRPGRPGLQQELERASGAGAPAVRLYPQHQDDAGGAAALDAVVAAGTAGLAVVLTVRIEDVRQRHHLDSAADLSPAIVRALARSDEGVRILVANAERSFVEEVHFGLTPQEARRVLWDVTWLWGPPEDHLSLLLQTVGWERFTLGTGMALRIPDAAFARLDLLDVSDAVRQGILGGNLAGWAAR
jgi:hypothetical protein